MGDFRGRVVFVTGAARGLGRAFAEEIGATGSVVVADIDGSAAKGAAEEIAQAGRSAMAVQCDVSDADQVERAVSEAIARFGGIDILVNNAGLHLSKYNRPFSSLSGTDIRQLFDVNMHGVVNCSLACRDSMSERGGGVIVNISSMAAYSATSPYGVSKLAVRGLTIAFATEFAPLGIRCNAIAPGLIATENAVADLPQSLVDDLVESRQLIHRLGQAEDIVAMLAFLCSDEASFITGETFKVSGGMPLWI